MSIDGKDSEEVPSIPRALREIYKFESRIRILEVSNKREIFSSLTVTIYLYI